jgi:hypothetical protein
MARRHLLLFATAILLAIVSCGPSRSRAVDASEQARQEAGRRLLGTWVLVSFQPEDRLEPMFASLLAAQMGAMTVQFDGQQMAATGVGVATTRRYRVTQAGGDGLTVVTYDDQGIPYDAAGQFRGNELWFASLTAPWRGRGVMRRAQ